MNMISCRRSRYAGYLNGTKYNDDDDLVWKSIGTISFDHQITFDGQLKQLMLSVFWCEETRIIVCNMKQNP